MSDGEMTNQTPQQKALDNIKEFALLYLDVSQQGKETYVQLAKDINVVRQDLQAADRVKELEEELSVCKLQLAAKRASQSSLTNTITDENKQELIGL